jgi:uncharacterized membrane protein (UPF0127 family)
MRRVIIHNTSKPSSIPIHAAYADSFLSRLRGLMFYRSLPLNEGILLVEQNESITNTSIHMLFMNFDITAVWLDKDNQVVDVKLARRWRLAYFPKSPAKMVLELHKDRLEDYHPGDCLSLMNA